MTMKAVDDEEANDIAILLKCVMANGGSFALVEAAKKHLIVVAEHAHGICDEATCPLCAAYAEENKTTVEESA